MLRIIKGKHQPKALSPYPKISIIITITIIIIIMIISITTTITNIIAITKWPSQVPCSRELTHSGLRRSPTPGARLRRASVYAYIYIYIYLCYIYTYAICMSVCICMYIYIYIYMCIYIYIYIYVHMLLFGSPLGDLMIINSQKVSRQSVTKNPYTF